MHVNRGDQIVIETGTLDSPRRGEVVEVGQGERGALPGALAGRPRQLKPGSGEEERR
jgi:hypothetical protein